MIDMTQLNCEEKDAIEELRRRLENEMPPDMLDDRVLYYRFLKARDFNLDKAEKMLRKHILWRKANQMSTFMEDFKPVEFFVKFAEPSSFGNDKEGDFVSYFPSGRLDGRDVMKCIKVNDYLKHLTWACEKIATVIQQRKEKAGGKICPQMTLIIDLNELTLGNATNKISAEVCMRMMHILQDNFPERLKSIAVINAPTYYVVIFSILKPMMSKAFLQKINIFGRSGWKEKFLENIDAEVLPVFLGGKRTDPDGNPQCRTFVSQGGKMPECYYMSDEDRYFKDKSRVTQILVPNSSKKEVCFDVTDECSVIHWEFLVKDKDIGFGLFLEASDETKELLPVQRYSPTDGVEIGSYRAKFTGKYIILFDNTYSWFSSKEVEYCITIIEK